MLLHSDMSIDILNPVHCETEPLVLTHHSNYNEGPMQNLVGGNEIETTNLVAQPDEPVQRPRTSNFSTSMHLFKGNIGAGILAMPKAVSNAGLLVGSIGIPIIGFICVHCMHLLVHNSKTLARRIQREFLDFSGTAEYAFLNGPERFQRFAPYAKFIVNSMLLFTQFGFCCVYLLFVAKSIHEVVSGLTHTEPITVYEYMAIVLPVMIIYNFVPDLSKLSHASMFGNILQIIALGIIFYFLFTDIPPISSVSMTGPLSKLPLYFGTLMYAFEGIGVVLPLENDMKTPKDFTGKCGVLNGVMIAVTFLYTTIGFFGYLKYGSDIESSITFNITAPIAGEIVRLFYALAIFLSYALQLYVPLEIIWPYLKRKFFLNLYSSRKQLAIELLVRTILVLITFVLAELIPLLDLFISLIGAFASSSLALIFPPIIDLLVIDYATLSRKWLVFILIKNGFIILLGIFGCVMGTYTSIAEMVTCFKNMTACDS